MQVRLLTSLANEFASFPYGSLYECDPEEAARLIEAQLAENVSGETNHAEGDETDAGDGDETDSAAGDQAAAGNADPAAAAAPARRRKRS